MKYELSQAPLNQHNYLTWLMVVEAKLTEWHAKQLAERPPAGEAELDLDNKIFVAIFSNISEEMKKTLLLKERTVQCLMSELKAKFSPFDKLEKYKALANLKSVRFADKFDMVSAVSACGRLNFARMMTRLSRLSNLPNALSVRASEA